jgi:hypothetical protein
MDPELYEQLYIFTKALCFTVILLLFAVILIPISHYAYYCAENVIRNYDSNYNKKCEEEDSIINQA